MLPQALVSTYGQYKRDTAAVTTWLTTTATALGFQLSGSDEPTSANATATATATATAITTGRLKGKARVEAKKKSAATLSGPPCPTTHIVSLRDLVPMAKLIADNKTPVPAHINTVLNAAIARRTAFAPKLVQHGRAPEPSSDTSHQHFVSVLEQVRNHLRPHMCLTTPSPDPDPNASNNNNASHPTLANRFEGLVVSEPSQQFLDAPDVIFTNPFDLGLSPPTVREARPKLAEILRNQRLDTPMSFDEMMSEILEADEFAGYDWEVEFAFSCLVGDLCTIRHRIRWIWESVRHSESGFMEAAIATDTAVELSKSLIDEVMPLVKRDGTIYKRMQANYLEQCIACGINVDHIIDDDDYAPVHPLVFDEATYQVADRTFFNAWQLLDIPAGGSAAHKKMIQQLHEKFDPGCDYDGMRFGDKLEHDESLFRTLLTDLSTVLGALPGFPVRDALMSSFETMGKTGEPSLHTAFAFQIHLDIAHSMGADVSKGYDALMTKATEIEEEIHLHLAYYALRNMDPPNSETRQDLCSILENIKALRADPVGDVARAIKGESGLPLSRAEIRGNRLLRGSPLLSGLILFVLRAEYR